MRLPLFHAIIATFLSGLVIFSTRLFPFALFSKREPPSFLRFIEKYIPPMIMASLLVYCFKDVRFKERPFGIPYIASLLCTVLLHIWKRNPMISIFSGTILFMALNKIL